MIFKKAAEYVVDIKGLCERVRRKKNLKRNVNLLNIEFNLKPAFQTLKLTLYDPLALVGI